MIDRTVENLVKPNERYIKQFKGGSMAKTFLIVKDGKMYVRKEVGDKSGLGLNKLEKQADWILDLEPEVAETFPKITTKDFGSDFGYYDMTYHDMPSFRDYLIETGEVNDDIRRIIKEIIAYGAKIASKEEESTKSNDVYIIKSHIDKMEQRCGIVAEKDEIFKRFFLNSPTIRVNGELCFNYYPIRDLILKRFDLLDALKPKKWHRSHGDFTFQNILTDGKNFKIIDPRGEGEDSLFYDISKLFQSCVGKYDLFTEGNYSVDYSLNDYSINYEIKKHEALFDEVFEVIREEIPKAFDLEEEWEIIALFYEASHFIAMAPFRYKENLSFALACYAIGVKKLNEVLIKWNNLKR